MHGLQQGQGTGPFLFLHLDWMTAIGEKTIQDCYVFAAKRRTYADQECITVPNNGCFNYTVYPQRITC